MRPKHAQSLVRLTLWIAAFALVGVIAAWGVMRILRPTVTVTRAVEGPVVQAFYSTGTIQPVREYPIKANVAGILTKVLVDKGDRVTEGQPLAEVSEPALQFALDRAEAELREKQVRADPDRTPVLKEFDQRIAAMKGMLEIAEREQERQTKALEARAGSQADLDRALDRVEQLSMDIAALQSQRDAKQLELQREVEVSQAAVNTAKWNLEQQTLRAPIDGVVLDRPTSQGTRVAVNDSIMRIADVQPERLVMRAAVDEEDIVHVSTKQPVRITLYSFPDSIFQGTVSRIYDQADADRRTFEVDVTFASPNPRFAPGMTGELAFVMGEKQGAVVVPTQAIQSGYAWTLTAEDALVRNDIEIGLRSVERTEIIRGIRPGDRVVISPADDLSPGQIVRTNEIEPGVAAGLNRKADLVEGAAFKGF